MDEVYSVGTFTQIREIQDLGDKLRMVVMGVRRIKLNGIAADDLTVASETPIEEKILKNGFRRRLKKTVPSGTKIEESEIQPENITPEKTPEGVPISDKKIDQILMVDTSNVVHHEFKQTQEIKALSNEIVKTIRDLITLNPIMRETISLLLQNGPRVAENPVYLSDLGAAITNADPKEQQDVLEELDVRLYL